MIWMIVDKLLIREEDYLMLWVNVFPQSFESHPVPPNCDGLPQADIAAGTTIGKGFQGVMKKWGFSGQPASHGNSLAHRAAGSIGNCQDPGKVWKGKKMAGRMGGVTRTVLSAHVFKVSSTLKPPLLLLWPSLHISSSSKDSQVLAFSVARL